MLILTIFNTEVAKKAVRWLSMCLFGLTAALAQTPAHVQIDWHTEHQTIHGWGGNAYTWVLNGWNGWENEQVHRAVYEELGTTHVRLVTTFEVWEEQNDDDDPEHFNWDYFETRLQGDDVNAQLLQADFATMKMIAYDYHDEVMLGIWDVPDWLVDNPEAEDHRHLRTSRAGEFAESVAAYLLWEKRSAGVEVPLIVLANEPDGYLLEYSPEALRELIRKVGRKFEREGIRTKIVAPDLASPYFSPEMWVTTLLEDPEVAKYMGAVSYHTYFVDGGPDQWNAQFRHIAELAETRRLPVCYTEIGTTPWNIPNQSWQWAFESAQMWHNVLTHGRANLAYQWALLGRDSAVNPDGSHNPIFSVLQQFFLHIPAGAVRIGATSNQADLLVSAYRHSASQRLTTVLINRSTGELKTEIAVEGLQISASRAFRSDSVQRHQETPVGIHSTNHVVISLSPQGITTTDFDVKMTRDEDAPQPPGGLSVTQTP